MMVKLTPLHFALNTSFQRTDLAYFGMHVILISSVHPRDFGVNAHQVLAMEDEGLRIVSSCRLGFVPEYVAQAVLEIIPDGVPAPISKVLCHSYGLLMRSASWELNFSRYWIQASFIAWELVAYLEGPISTCRETLALTTLPGSFQGLLTIVDLQRALPGHYLTAFTAPLTTTDTAPFKLTHLSPSNPCPTLNPHRGGSGNADSESNNDGANAANT